MCVQVYLSTSCVVFMYIFVCVCVLFMNVYTCMYPYVYMCMVCV